MKPLKKALLFFVILLQPLVAFSQVPAKWSVNGNSTVNGDFFGTTNNQPILFYTNNVEAMRLKANGELKINSLSGSGNNFVFSNSSGVLYTKPFSPDTNKFLTEAGVFRTASSFTGWKYNGNNIHTINGSYVGIGTNNPQYQLDVVGDAHLHGTLYAQGIILATKMQADTVKSTSMISINNNLRFFSSSIVNDIYTLSGDVRLQSRVGYTGNTILNAGNNGNVGIGIYSPLYKFDVNGDARVSGCIRVQRISTLPGDSLIIMGDSTIYVSANSNKITHSTNSTVYKGMSIGTAGSSGHGLNSLALGTSVWTTSNAIHSIVMGSGGQTSLKNDVANSLMVGFNSNIPTFFIGTSAGNNTIGKVGLGTTTPQSDFQLRDGISRVNISALPGNSYGVLGYMGFNAEINSTTSYMHTTGNGTINTGGIISLATDGSLRFNVLPNVAGGNDILQDPLHFSSGAQMRIYGSHIEIGQGTIGTSSPYYNDVQTKLMVGGRIMCQDVIVSLVDWQDEVFDSTYNLMSMDSVNAFIQTNGHLPGVPSENKIETEGMSIAETAEIQQAKIEEMMLYILQLNERMKALEAENAKLKVEGGK